MKLSQEIKLRGGGITFYEFKMLEYTYFMKTNLYAEI